MPLSQNEADRLAVELKREMKPILKELATRSFVIGFAAGLIAAYCIDATLGLLW